MAISKVKRKNDVVEEVNCDDLLASFGFSGDFLDFETPVKKRRQDERLLRTVDRVGDKIDSLEESLARREQENQFAESLLNNLIDDDEATSSIVQHNHVLDQEQYYCNYCDIEFLDDIYLMAHMLDRHVTAQKKHYHCSECPDTFDDSQKFEKHFKKHCQANSCNLCRDYPDETQAHSIEDVVRLKLVCDFCTYTDSSIPSFQIHCLICKNNPSNDDYEPTNEGRVCPKCSQVFNSNSHLLKHIDKKHSGPSQAEIVKKFVCEECGRRFISGSSLGGHRRVHKNKPAGVSKTKMLGNTSSLLRSGPEQSARLTNGHSINQVAKPKVSFAKPEPLFNMPVTLNGALTQLVVQPVNHQPSIQKTAVQEEEVPVENMPDLF